MKKISLMLLSLLMVSACSNGFQKIEIDNTNPSEVRIATNKELNTLQSRGALKSSDKLYVANLGLKNGGQFLTKINFNSFKTKASVDGVLAKTSDDVHSVDVYLLKLSSNYNPAVNKDPIALSKMTTNPVWMRNMLKNGSEINLLFTGVPGLESKQYYVGVVAKDVDGNVISKNGYAWTGDTLAINGLDPITNDPIGGFNLSSTGVGVNPTSLEVSETDALSIAVSLKDAVGAKLDTTVTVNDGSSNLPNVSGSLYKVSKIVFTSDRDGERDIYIMGSNGSSPTRLTNDIDADNNPDLSRDGSKIVFVSNGDLYVMNVDGTNRSQIVTNASEPSWSADGTKIAFVSNGDIYVVDSDGNNQVQLTNTNDNSNPSWSGDGSKIVFQSSRDGNGEIYVMDSDGNNQINVSNNNSSEYDPSFSFDGSKIVFESYRDGNPQIYVMNANGSDQKNISNNSYTDNSPCWSNDGSKIVFHSYREDGNGQIYIMNADGSNQINLSNNTYMEYFASF